MNKHHEHHLKCSNKNYVPTRTPGPGVSSMIAPKTGDSGVSSNTTPTVGPYRSSSMSGLWSLEGPGALFWNTLVKAVEPPRPELRGEMEDLFMWCGA